jgi:hypothetical protein
MSRKYKSVRWLPGGIDSDDEESKESRDDPEIESKESDAESMIPPPPSANPQLTRQGRYLFPNTLGSDEDESESESESESDEDGYDPGSPNYPPPPSDEDSLDFRLNFNFIPGNERVIAHIINTMRLVRETTVLHNLESIWGMQAGRTPSKQLLFPNTWDPVPDDWQKTSINRIRSIPFERHKELALLALKEKLNLAMSWWWVTNPDDDVEDPSNNALESLLFLDRHRPLTPLTAPAISWEAVTNAFLTEDIQIIELPSVLRTEFLIWNNNYGWGGNDDLISSSEREILAAIDPTELDFSGLTMERSGVQKKIYEMVQSEFMRKFNILVKET